MATSKFQDVRSALKTLIVARFVVDTISSVDVFEYKPVGNATREDQVWFDRITVDQEPLSMGGTSRVIAEEIRIDVVVAAPRVGSDQDDAKLAEQRAEAIWASVENALRHGSTVGSTVMFTDIDGFESIIDYDELGAVGVIQATVVAQANL